jgi:hypothetical protein
MCSTINLGQDIIKMLYEFVCINIKKVLISRLPQPLQSGEDLERLLFEGHVKG